MSDASTSLLETKVETTHEESKAAVGGNGSGETKQATRTYLDQVAKGIREKLNPEDFPPSINDLVTGYADFKTKVAKGIVRPNEGAPEADWKAYRKAVGVPESPDGYTFDQPKLPEGMSYSTQFETWFKSQAHKLDIPADKAKELFTSLLSTQVDGFKEIQARQEKAKVDAQAAQREQYLNEAKALRTDWGDKFPERLAGANAVLNDDRIVPQAARKEIMDKGLNNSGWLIRVLDLVSRATKSDSRLGLGREAGDGKARQAGAGIDYGKDFSDRYK